MKIIINAVNIAPGGGLVVLLGLLHAWREHPDVEIVKVFAGRQETAERIKSELPELAVECFMANHPPWRRFLGQFLFLGSRIDRIQAESVISTQFHVPRCRTPQIVHHQNLFRFECSLASRLRKLQFSKLFKDILARRAINKAAANVFISDYMKAEAAKRVPSSSANSLITIHNGLSRIALKKAGERINRGAESNILLAIQSPAEHKDTPSLLDTLKRLQELTSNIEWHLYVVGPGDWRPLEEYAEKLKVCSAATFLGYVNHEQLTELYQQAFCLLFPSRLEGFGNPPLEAMAHQCPVVASNCTAIPEVVGDAGLLVPPGRPEAFADAILRLRNQKGLRDILIDKGLQRIKLFSWQRSAEQMLELMRDVNKP